MYKEQFEESQRQLAELKQEVENLTKANQMLTSKLTFLASGGDPADVVVVGSDQQSSAAIPASASTALSIVGRENGFEDCYQYILQRVKQDPAVLAILKAKPTIRVDVVEHTLELNGDTLAGRVALLIHDGWFSEPRTLAECVDELRRGGCRQAPPNVWRQLKDITKKGFLRNDDKTYTAVKGMRVEKT